MEAIWKELNKFKKSIKSYKFYRFFLGQKRIKTGLGDVSHGRQKILSLKILGKQE